MMISTKGRYALRFLIDMSEHEASGYVPLKDIADRQDISEKYLEAIVRELVKANVITGLRGKGGGYKLVKAPDDYNVLEILEILEGPLAPVECLSENAPACAQASSCRTLDLWKGLYKVTSDYLSQFTIADLMSNGSDAYDYSI